MRNIMLFILATMTAGTIGGTSLNGNSREKKIVKNTLEISHIEVKGGYENNFTFEDGTVFTTESKHKVVRQEELDQFIAIKGEDFDYIKVPSYR